MINISFLHLGLICLFVAMITIAVCSFGYYYIHKVSPKTKNLPEPKPITTYESFESKQKQMKRLFFLIQKLSNMVVWSYYEGAILPILRRRGMYELVSKFKPDVASWDSYISMLNTIANTIANSTDTLDDVRKEDLIMITKFVTRLEGINNQFFKYDILCVDPHTLDEYITEFEGRIDSISIPPDRYVNSKIHKFFSSLQRVEKGNHPRRKRKGKSGKEDV